MRDLLTSVRDFKNVVAALFAISSLTACGNHYDNMDVNYPNGTIPVAVTPFADANTEFDDFNSGPTPTLWWQFPFYFSSNRSTQGGTFDIESLYVTPFFNQNTGAFILYGLSGPAWPGTNTSSNEYGPFIQTLTDSSTMYLYASDVSGNLDIYHVGGDGVVSTSSALNSGFDDAYPTFFKNNSIYFTSNKGGDFDIYSVGFPDGTDLPTWLSDVANAVGITKVDVLSTTSDDKCPYINGNLLVFTSDRPGGYGGFDLYYAVHGPDGWGTPVNFGPSINTPYDEYRPAVIYAEEFVNDMMIFSSNRPGGMGGYDLYYVGIPKMTGQLLTP